MISISIGPEQRSLSDADPHWVARQIDGRQRDGINVCVVVNIDVSDARLSLATPSCARSGGGGRRPNATESQLITAWNQLGLNDMGFTAGNVIAFLQRLRHLLG